ncbi:hypothetical protein R3W88_025193 [Solanum pinnatisectum]|uniref:Retrotransposon gag domain-containing protein n=1 Tax=Solanum pinnatisectum TaxID=50273 RepID=A0AAV9M299_9SOLN|nr:hypothetical protein R3W88_025193 [Solanum pinnatisectum]
MANRIVIDLVEDELNCEEAESYQDKIDKLEGKVVKMEQEIDGIKEMIADLKNSSNEYSLNYNLRDSSDEDLEGYSPICTTQYPNFDCNAQHFNIETNQISFTNELASQLGTNLVEMERENETPYNLVNIPMYDGTGLPQNHLKAYLDWLTSIRQGNEFNMILFVRTLTGPALLWYANQDTRKWFSWVDMAKDFIKQYGPLNRAFTLSGIYYTHL